MKAYFTEYLFHEKYSHFKKAYNLSYKIFSFLPAMYVFYKTDTIAVVD